jgi:hypothetical protein
MFATSRTRPRPIYYFTGLDLSRRYESRDVLDEPSHGRDQSAPEHQSQTQCNPFHADIYYIGNLVRQEFIEVRPSFLSPFTFDFILLFLVEMLWLRFYGGSNQLDDARRSN